MWGNNDRWEMTAEINTGACACSPRMENEHHSYLRSVSRSSLRDPQE